MEQLLKPVYHHIISEKDFHDYLQKNNITSNNNIEKAFDNYMFGGLLSSVAKLNGTIGLPSLFNRQFVNLCEINSHFERIQSVHCLQENQFLCSKSEICQIMIVSIDKLVSFFDNNTNQVNFADRFWCELIAYYQLSIPYFDVDIFDDSDLAKKDIKEIISLVKDVIAEVLETYFVGFERKKAIFVVYNSSRIDKISLHILVHNYSVDMVGRRLLAAIFCKHEKCKHAQSTIDKIYNDLGFDADVYNLFQPLRLYKTKKPYKENIKRLEEPATATYYMSLVTYVPENYVPLQPKHLESCVKNLNDKEIRCCKSIKEFADVDLCQLVKCVMSKKGNKQYHSLFAEIEAARNNNNNNKVMSYSDKLIDLMKDILNKNNKAENTL